MYIKTVESAPTRAVLPSPLRAIGAPKLLVVVDVNSRCCVHWDEIPELAAEPTLAAATIASAAATEAIGNRATLQERLDAGC